MSALLKAVPRTGTHCHFMLKEVAEGIAAEVYESWASHCNEFYGEHPSQEEYVKASWPLFIEQARTTLAGLLATNISEELKEQISDALIKDATLMRGRKNKIALHYRG